MAVIDATLRSPAGFLDAIEAKADRLGFDHVTLLQRAGVTAEEYAALDAALSAADGETWRRLANAVKSQPALCDQTSQVLEAPDGRATADSYGGHWQSHHGDIG
ncbi:hypothetical protein WOC76_06970 [Methylocystis sp. IM3]|uniref:hypothetical protein n=1 Tax=unclassified Methylocystis TaxID=2625913 RepID=UPI0030FC8E40